MNEYSVINASKSEKIKIINEYYDRLHILNNYTTAALRDKVYSMSLEAEKEHRRFSGNTGISKSVAAKLLTVRYILEGMQEGLDLKCSADKRVMIDITDTMHLRIEYIQGRAIGVKYCDDIASVIYPEAAAQFIKYIDYAELMQ